MHIMNLNIYFQISSEADLVLDSRVHESILLYDGDSLENIAGQESGNGEAGVEQQALTLGRLKQFYIDVADAVFTSSGPATSSQALQGLDGAA